MNRILVVLPSWVGDVCMATPVLRHLAAEHPTARIIAFGRPMLASLMDGLPFVHGFIPGSMRGRAAIAELGAVRKGQFDAVLLLPNSMRSALFSRLSGIPERVGTARDGRAWLLTHPFAQTRRMKSAVDFYADLAQWWTRSPLSDRVIELRVRAHEVAGAGALLLEATPRTHADAERAAVRDLILLNPGANRLDKRWPGDSFARAAAAIRAQHSSAGTLQIAVTGSRSEATLCADIAGRCGAVDLCARGITLGSLKGILQRTALLITNDTGPRHMAAALNTPTIALFGPTDWRWTPLNYPLERRLVAEPFLTEDRVADDHPHECAIDRIAVGDVVGAAGQLLAARDAAESHRDPSRIPS